MLLGTNPKQIYCTFYQIFLFYQINKYILHLLEISPCMQIKEELQPTDSRKMFNLTTTFGDGRKQAKQPHAVA